MSSSIGPSGGARTTGMTSELPKMCSSRRRCLPSGLRDLDNVGTIGPYEGYEDGSGYGSRVPGDRVHNPIRRYPRRTRRSRMNASTEPIRSAVTTLRRSSKEMKRVSVAVISRTPIGVTSTPPPPPPPRFAG